MQTLSGLDIQKKIILVREDLNVPLDDNGHITDDTRIQRALPTIQMALEKGAKQVIVMSHLGRPTEGEFDEAYSLKPVAKRLGELLSVEVPVCNLHSPFSISDSLVLLENVRFNLGEKSNSEALSQQYADLCDVFVMDAFATAHRAQASTEGVTRFAKVACAGPLLEAELNALNQSLTNPKKPVLAIVGGSKVSTKIDVLKTLIHKVDAIIVGGGIANTFLAATGVNVGNSLYEADWLEQARELLAQAKQQSVKIPLPGDVAVGKKFDAAEPAVYKTLEQIEDDDMVFDIGPNTMHAYKPVVDEAATIVWNGPVGVFEFSAFEHGTKALGRAIADSEAFSVAGGGDTLAALAKYDLSDKISYISTGGGAFLEWLEGKSLPAVQALEDK